jgi:signal transduction histidine kinase
MSFLARLMTFAGAVSVAGPLFGDQHDAALDETRFLVIYSSYPTLPAYVSITEGLKRTLDQEFASGYELYSEYRDIQRFPDLRYGQAFTENLALRYSGRDLSAVLAIGPEALAIALEQRRSFAPDVPIVFGSILEDNPIIGDLPPDAFGVVGSYDVAGTLALARGLQPDARRLVVFSGSSDFDQAWEQRAREAFSAVEGLEVDYVSDLTIDEFVEAAGTLERDTILIILTIFRDAAGQFFSPRDVVERIASNSRAPAYGVYDTYVGEGVVGGRFETFDRIGSSVAEMTARVVKGNADESRSIPVPSEIVVDWRQLERHGLDVNRLPDGARVLFYEPTFWQQNRSLILAAAGVIVVQSGTILALVVQDRRRRTATREAEQRRLEVAHMSRTTQLGELSGAIAHELNQPLTAILANAEAGLTLLSRAAPDLAEIEEILTDIANDDRRAAATIAELRQLMSNGESGFERIDLNGLAAEAARMFRSELVVRGVSLETRLAREELIVNGNALQLKQVLINCIMNAVEALTDQTGPNRTVVVLTELCTDGWRELAVQDNGPGLPTDMEDPFRPFATTKKDGMGMGLAICKTIVTSHGGSLAFEPASSGARIVMRLPPP